MPRFSPQSLLLTVIVVFVFASLLLYRNVSNKGDINDIYQEENRWLHQRVSELNQKLGENARKVDELEKELLDAKQKNEVVDNGRKSDQLGAADDVDEPVKDMDRRGGKQQVVHQVLEDHRKNEAEAFKAVVLPPRVDTLVCSVGDLAYSSTGDIQMLSAYEAIPFENKKQKAGLWTQGFEITYDKKAILSEPRLEVFVVPHSHCDPGWIYTFEEYFQRQTKNILDNMLANLPALDGMKFIYAEMSFFELWWSTLPKSSKDEVRNLLKDGKLEIVTGGWVMSDEANSNYYATVMELFEGHEFVKNQLNYTPTNHWSIDPFGLSPTLTYLAKESSIRHAAIQRVHYEVKKYLAEQRNLEFTWRQLWAGSSTKTDLLTNMFPFYSYDVPHTCGPDPEICCQFDFRRLVEFGCAWGQNPQAITAQNVAERAALIADQYRKKAQLYKANVLLIPLGDDFRYDDKREFKLQHENFGKLFQFINADTSLNMHVQFGTLGDYFTALEGRLAESNVKLPTLTGDFFTYADREDHYWSGYYTSRPFYKHMDRSLQHYVRAADVSFALASMKSAAGKTPWTGLSELYNSLVDARRMLSLFQHHDGVTGTAKTAVMTDYGEKMAAALNWTKQVIISATAYLINVPLSREQTIYIDEEHFVDKLPTNMVIEGGATLVLSNSKAYESTEVVCVRVSSIKARVALAMTGDAASDDAVPQQISPVVHPAAGKARQFDVDHDRYELCFLATVPALGLARFHIIETNEATKLSTSLRTNFHLDTTEFSTSTLGSEAFTLTNNHVAATFDGTTGLLRSLTLNNSTELAVDIGFAEYGARLHNPKIETGGDSPSGAYLFLPPAPATDIPVSQPAIIVIDGPVRKTVHVRATTDPLLWHSVSLDVHTPALLVRNRISILAQKNAEVVMRLKTGIVEGQEFYTDLNGFHMIRRKRFDKLPIQAHFFPMPGTAFIEDRNTRLSLIGRQALGVASLKSGWMEVVLDRRLMQDDVRGLYQPIQDNVETESIFRLFVEHLAPPKTTPPAEPTVGYHSFAAHRLIQQIHYPAVVLFGQMDHTSLQGLPQNQSGLQKTLPCDVHLVALRTLSFPTEYDANGARSTQPQPAAGLVLHRLGVECRATARTTEKCQPLPTNGAFVVKDMFGNAIKSVNNGSMTLLHTDESDLSEVNLGLMEVKTVRINW